MRSFVSLLALIALLRADSFAADGQAGADPSADQLEKDAAADRVPEGKINLHRMLDRSAGRYTLTAGDELREPLKLHCVLRWANVSRGSVDGATYVWTAEGRPLAAVCVYPWAGQLCDNFQSLSRGPISAKADGRVLWNCAQPGAEFHTVPDAPPPEQSAAARLRQMKSLARGFRTTLMGWHSNDADREVLRMLPTPVYRYEGHEADGAIFAFVQGTDPEAFLLLEVGKTGDEQGETEEWQFAMARRTSGWLETHYKGNVAWKAERISDYSDPKRPYFQYARPLPAVEEAE